MTAGGVGKLSLIFFLMGLPAYAGEAKLSLQDAVRYALANSPELSSAQKNVEIGELQLKSARAKFFPSLDVSGTHGLIKQYPPADTDPWSSAVTLGLTENLYDNGQSINQYEITHLNLEEGGISALKTRDKLILDVTAEFFHLSLAVKLASLSEEQLSVLRAQLKTVNSLYRQGLRTRKDYLRFKTQVQRGEIAFRSAQESIGKSENELRRLLGAPKDAFPSFQPLDQNPLKDVPNRPLPVDGTFDVRLAKVQMEIRPIETNLAERKFWPQVNLTTGINYQNSNYLNSTFPFYTDQQYGWNALLTLSFNLLDWGTRARDVEIARTKEQIQDNELRRTRLQLQADLDSLMLDLTLLKTNYESTRDLQDAEQETYRTIQREYEEGKVPYLDLITSLNSLLDAKTQLVSVEFELAEKIAIYHYHQGNIHEAMAL